MDSPNCRPKKVTHKALQPAIKEFLAYLQKNSQVRANIAAPVNQTLLYAGNFIRPAWQFIEQVKQRSPEAAAKKTLPDVLATITTPGQPHPNLLAWAKALDALQPWKENGFIAWRALSGIFAANASGAVSFQIGSNVSKDEKVFAATELAVLLRNPAIDAIARYALGYYQRCIQSGQTAVNLGLMRR